MELKPFPKWMIKYFYGIAEMYAQKLVHSMRIKSGLIIQLSQKKEDNLFKVDMVSH